MKNKKLQAGRNDPCPCGSRRQNGLRKKFKHCCIGQPSLFPIELSQKINESSIETLKKEYDEFILHHARSECYLCSLPYDQYDKSKPCIHWLLKPSNIEKDDIAAVLELEGCFKPQTFLRWLANIETFGTQINDLDAEGDQSKIIDTTITYKNYEWSFSCSSGDLEGHKDRKIGKNPHFHFQMKIDNRRFISYNDYHPAFSRYDLYALQVKRNEVPGLVAIDTFDIGMQGLMNMVADNNLRNLKTASDTASAQYHMQTIVNATPGTTLSGNEIADLMNKSNRTGIPIATLARRLKNASIKTFIEPGPDIINKSSRTTRNKRK